MPSRLRWHPPEAPAERTRLPELAPGIKLMLFGGTMLIAAALLALAAPGGSVRQDGLVALSLAGLALLAVGQIVFLARRIRRER